MSLSRDNEETDETSGGGRLFQKRREAVQETLSSLCLVWRTTSDVENADCSERRVSKSVDEADSHQAAAEFPDEDEGM
jgi:hypothetical protein